ncbi:hypothetical protein BLS_003821 [Venturia inaequalis]|uniref:Uncharacterized protein n=1 Tax=Venturia inaequalis TaxID=5025 RepID=A0A8H3YXU8_VENIN|nr:hypothetical protein BLS_003821 [Venturia inaequalis]
MSERKNQTISKDDRYTLLAQPSYPTNGSPVSPTSNIKPSLQKFTRLVLKLNGKVFMDSTMPRNSSLWSESSAEAVSSSTTAASLTGATRLSLRKSTIVNGIQVSQSKQPTTTDTSSKAIQSAKPLTRSTNTRLEARNKTIDDPKKKIQDLQKEVRQVKALSDNGIRKIQDLEHTARVKDLDIKSQKQSIQTLSAGARGSFTMIKSSEKRLEELGAKIREHEAERVEWKSEKVISEGLHAQIKDENETLEAEAAESAREIEGLKISNVSLRQRIKASRKKIGKVSSQKLLHQRGAMKAKAATSRLAKRVIELKKLDRDHNAHAKEKDKAHNNRIKEKNNKITLLNSKIHQLESTISSVQQQANLQTDKQTAHLQARNDTITQRFNTVDIETGEERDNN